MSQANFQKRQREKARQDRAAAKAARRAERGVATAPEPVAPARQQEDVLAELAALHGRFADGHIEFDDFEASKQRLTEQLDVR